MKSLQESPVRPDDHLCYRSRPRYGIRAGLQHRELTVHVIVHQGVALVGFLQHGINDDASGDILQFHNGCPHHERNVSGACDRQDRLGIHTARIRDDRPGCGDRDVSGGIGIEERIAAEVDRKGTVRIAPAHIFEGDLIGDGLIPNCPYTYAEFCDVHS